MENCLFCKITVVGQSAAAVIGFVIFFMTPPRLIVGLGNPGSHYADNRHNLGFWFIERLAQDLKIQLSVHSKFFGMTGRAGNLWLLKPAVYMNCSGQSVVSLALFYKILPDEILVVHDDLDLLPGGIKIKQGGGDGGHNGIKDIQSRLGTRDFWRLRLGIGHPGDRDAVTSYVLKAPLREEQELIDKALDRCLMAWPQLEVGDYAAAQRLLHTKPLPVSK